MATRRATRKSSDPFMTHTVTAGIAGVTGLALGMHFCDQLINMVQSVSSLLIWAAVVYIIAWFSRALIASIVVATVHVWQEQKVKAYYRKQGYSMVDGVLFLNGEKVNV